MHRCRWPATSLLAGALAAGCGSVLGSPDGGGAGGSGGGAGGGTGGAACAFASTYTITESAGLIGITGVTLLQPPSEFNYERQVFTAPLDAGPLTCDPAMPACNDPARIDVSDLEAAIANPDVQTTLAWTTRKYYGDRGVADGPNFDFNRGDGAGFDVGLPCDTPSSTCTPIPPGINALVSLLRALIQQQLMDPSCSAITN
jgi:hypothetical protein